MRIKLFIILLLMFSCNSKKQKLPIISYYIDDEGKKVNYTINRFNFKNQYNQSFSDSDIQDKIVLANFFFTRCPTICPKIKKSLDQIGKDFIDDDDFLITSFSIDPKYDSVPILKSYAKDIGTLSSKWYFLCGSEKELSHIAELFRTSFRKEEHLQDFYHSSFAAIVDKKQRIRGYYNLLDKKSLIQLKKDIKTLLNN